MTNPAAAWLLLTTRSIGVELTPGGHGHLTAADVGAALQGLPRGPFLLGMAVLAGDESVKIELAERVYRDIVLDLARAWDWQTAPGSRLYHRLAALAVFEMLNGQRCLVCNGKGTCPREVIEQKARTKQAQQERYAKERQQLAKKLHLLRRTEWLAAALEKSAAHMNEFGYRPTEKHLFALRRARANVEAIEAEFSQLTQGGMRCRSCKGTGLIKKSDRNSGRPKLTDVQRAWAVGMARSQWYHLWVARYEVVQGELERWRSECLSHVRRWLDGQDG